MRTKTFLMAKGVTQLVVVMLSGSTAWSQTSLPVIGPDLAHIAEHFNKYDVVLRPDKDEP
jgi:hypothetical protein